MRLTQNQRNIITTTIKEFDSNAEIRLFGSRMDDQKKGGDIDIFIISSRLSYRNKLAIRYKLKDKLGDRKIDILIKEQPDNAFSRFAYKNSIII